MTARSSVSNDGGRARHWSRLVDAERVDEPISLSELVWILANVRNTGEDVVR